MGGRPYLFIHPFDVRQQRVLRPRLGEFDADVNLRKCIAIASASRAIAQRDRAPLVEDGLLTVGGRGKAARYVLTQLVRGR